MRLAGPRRHDEKRLLQSAGPLAIATLTLTLAACGSASPPPSHGRAGKSSSSRIERPQHITITPARGTSASPRTPITLSEGAYAREHHPRILRVLIIHVVGSRSGYHTGILKPYQAGIGMRFLPTNRFLPGERVAAYAKVQLIDANDRSKGAGRTSDRSKGAGGASDSGTGADHTSDIGTGAGDASDSGASAVIENVGTTFHIARPGDAKFLTNP